MIKIIIIIVIIIIIIIIIIPSDLRVFTRNKTLWHLLSTFEKNLCVTLTFQVSVTYHQSIIK